MTDRPLKREGDLGDIAEFNRSLMELADNMAEELTAFTDGLSRAAESIVEFFLPPFMDMATRIAAFAWAYGTWGHWMGMG